MNTMTTLASTDLGTPPDLDALFAEIGEGLRAGGIVPYLGPGISALAEPATPWPPSSPPRPPCPSARWAMPGRRRSTSKAIATATLWRPG